MIGSGFDDVAADAHDDTIARIDAETAMRTRRLAYAERHDCFLGRNGMAPKVTLNHAARRARVENCAAKSAMARTVTARCA
jgi:hypothetical protein